MAALLADNGGEGQASAESQRRCRGMRVWCQILRRSSRGRRGKQGKEGGGEEGGGWVADMVICGGDLGRFV